MMIGDGLTAKFWEDRWIDGRSISEIAPLLYACIPKRRRKHMTVAEGLQDQGWARDIQRILGVHEIGQYLMLWHLMLWQKLEGLTLTEEPDRLIWKWTSSGVYTAQSCYRASFGCVLRCMEADLEILGTPQSEVLPLVGEPGSLLDGQLPHAAWPTASSPVPPLR